LLFFAGGRLTPILLGALKVIPTVTPGNRGRTARRIERYGGVVVVGLMLAGCVPQSFDDPVAVMLDHDADVRFRHRAAQQYDAQGFADERYFNALDQLLWEPGYPVWQRRYAIDRFIEFDPAAFQETLASRITAIPSWDARCYLFDLAIQNDWENFTATAVLSYAQAIAGIPDRDRPERAVIAHGNPGQTVEQAIGRVFVNADGNASRVHQVAAWEVLNRLVERAGLIRLLDRSLPSTGLIVDLKASRSYLHVLPSNREGVLWLAYLRDPAHRVAWDRFAAMAGRLTPDQRRGLELRHLPVLSRVDTNPSLIAARRDEPRPSGSGARSNIPPSNQNADHPGDVDPLCWADWAVVHLISRSLGDRGLVDELFVQADADFNDKKSEHGGVLDWHDAKMVAHAYAPLMRRHDRIFYPPPEMVEHLYTAVAHYHFHAQDYHNEQFAKPGRGDLELARRMNFNGLIFTFVGRDSLHVSYYQPNGAVIDLGVIHRLPGNVPGLLLPH